MPAHRRTKREKPEKPSADFPLQAHPNGQWCKRIRGDLHYFGVWDDPQAALNKYLDERDDLQAGRTPRPADDDGLTIQELCNDFLKAKLHQVETGELSPRTFADYKRATDAIVKEFGLRRLVSDLRSSDFTQFRRKLAEGRGVVALGNIVRHIRIVFRYASENELIERPVKFGTVFREPSKKAKRKAGQQSRQKNGLRMFEAAELRTILDALDGKPIKLKSARKPVTLAADPTLKAMVLLAINCGFGQSDVASLPMPAVDLKKASVEFPRPKTGVERRCPLWPETVAALRPIIAARPAPRDPADEGLLFLTATGRRWVRTVRTGEKFTPIDEVAEAFAEVLKALGLKRPGLNFYAIRHTFRTIADESRDEPAVDLIMGHADEADDMGARYVERIDRKRLADVANSVRRWLWPVRFKVMPRTA